MVDIRVTAAENTIRETRPNSNFMKSQVTSDSNPVSGGCSELHLAVYSRVV